MDGFSDRVTVITGGGRGLGKAFGAALSGQGAKVVVVDIDEAVAISAASGMGGEGLYGDVSDERAMSVLMAKVAERHGGIDILINNAGIHGAEATHSIGSLGTERTRHMFDVNIWGVIYCTLAARPYMAGRSGAAIVNMSSMAGYRSATAYGVTKLAVRGLTIEFANELAIDKIRVNAIAPGLIVTDTIRADLSDDIMQAVRSRQILQGDGEEADIVEAMLYLASDRSKFITGETLRVSGGGTLQI